MKRTLTNPDFYVKIIKKDTNDNYNIFASVFEKGFKTPTCGTVFKDSTNITEILEWANKQIEIKNIYEKIIF